MGLDLELFLLFYVYFPFLVITIGFKIIIYNIQIPCTNIFNSTACNVRNGKKKCLLHDPMLIPHSSHCWRAGCVEYKDGLGFGWTNSQDIIGFIQH